MRFYTSCFGSLCSVYVLLLLLAVTRWLGGVCLSLADLTAKFLLMLHWVTSLSLSADLLTMKFVLGMLIACPTNLSSSVLCGLALMAGFL